VDCPAHAGFHQTNNHLRQITVKSWRANLVGDDWNVVATLRDFQNLVGKTTSHSAIQPRRPENASVRQYFPDSFLCLGFGVSVDVDWTHLVVWLIRLALASIKNVVGTD